MLDSGFRRKDRKQHFQAFCEFIKVDDLKAIKMNL